MRKTARLLVTMGAALLLASAVAPAAPKIAITKIHYVARGNDNYARSLNDEYLIFKNKTNRTVNLKGWKVYDKGRIHTYTFKRFKLGAGKKVTLHTDQGHDTRKHLYWGRSYGAVWNNEGDTVTLVNRRGAVVARESY